MKNKLQPIKTSIKHQVSRNKQPASSIELPEARLKGVLFDFDGVVLDSMKQHVKAWQYAFKKEGVNLTELEIYLMEGMGVKAVVESVCKKYDLPITKVQALIKEKSEFYKQHLHVKFYDGFFNLLEYIKSQNLKMVVVTGGDRSRIIPFAEQYLDGYFEGFVCSDDVQKTKPSSEPYIKGLEILNLKSNECLVIENAPLGIKAAKAAGLKTIAIETTLSKEYLVQADYIVRSFSEVQSVIEKQME